MNKVIFSFVLLLTLPSIGKANNWSPDNWSPLFQAISNDDPKKLEEILDQNPALIDSRDDFFGYTPLVFISNENFGKHGLEIVKILLSKGADLEATDKSGRTALSGIVSRADSENALQIAQALIDKGAKINTADQNGYTPLMLAWTGPAASLLIKNKANIDQVDSWGRTALMLNAMHSDIESPQVKVLVEAGASLDRRDPDGNRALEFAKENSVDARLYEHPKQWDTIVFLEKAMGLPLDCKAGLYPGIKDQSDPKTVDLVKGSSGRALVGKWIMTDSVAKGVTRPPVKARWGHQDSGDMGCNIFSIAQLEFSQDGQLVINGDFKSAFKLFANNPSKVQFKTRDYNRGFMRDSYEGGVYSMEIKEIRGVKVLTLKPEKALDDVTPMAVYHYVWSGPETSTPQLACGNNDQPGTPITEAAVENAVAGTKQVDATPAQPLPVVKSEQLNGVVPIN